MAVSALINEAMPHSLVIIACGNPSRGDDALGPLCVERIRAFAVADVEVLEDFQLHIEHAVDLEQRRLALFIDASVACSAPYQFTRIYPVHDTSYSSHALSPAAVLHVYQQVYDQAPPPAFQIAIRGISFNLGEPLSTSAEAHLAAALEFIERLLAQPDLAIWDQWREPTTLPAPLIDRGGS